MKAPSRRTRVIAGAVLSALCVLTITSCSESALAPAPEARTGAAANSSLLGGLLNSLHLLNCTPLPAATASANIGPAGGTINVGPHKFVVPPGALSSTVLITATAPSVPRREVDFQPHGLQFDEPAYLTMSYQGCSLLSLLLPKKIVYTDALLNPLELILSLDNILTQKVTGRIEHFSGYVLWQ